MRIRTRMGVSLDGYVARADGWPVLLSMPAFQPGVSYGYGEFIADCDAVVMGRSTFLPALGAPSWPWPGLQVYVLTSKPLPAGTPVDVTPSIDGPAGLLKQLRSRESDRDVHLVGGPMALSAFRHLGGLDQLELLVLPFMAGGGIPLSLPASDESRFRLVRSDRVYSDGTVELVYQPSTGSPR
jgi:dihydrofolate reductase